MIYARVKNIEDIAQKHPGFTTEMATLCGKNLSFVKDGIYYRPTSGKKWVFDVDWLIFNVTIKKNFKGSVKGGNV